MWKLLCLLSALAAPLEARHQPHRGHNELYNPVAQETFESIPYSSSVPVWQYSPPSNFVCEQPGVFPHPLHCQYFYVCVAFTPARLFRFLHQCDVDRVYSAESQSCVVPLDGKICPGWDDQSRTDAPNDSVTDDNKQTTTTQSSTTQDDSALNAQTANAVSLNAGKDDTLTNEQSKDTGVAQLFANPLKQNAGILNDGFPADDTQKKTPATTELSMCDGGKESLDCVDEGFYGVPDDCSKFYRCIAFGFRFIKYEFLCPAGTIWDDSLKTCNFRAAVAQITCKDKSQAVTSTPSPTSTVPSCPDCNCPVAHLARDQRVIVCPSGFREHQTYCNLFYQCYTNDNVDVNYLLFLCPNGTVFDMKNIRCIADDARLQSCDIFEPSNKQYGNRIVNPWNTDLCPGQGRFPYGESCSNLYINCDYNDRGELEGNLHKCPPEQLFSIIKDKCMPFAVFPYCSRDSLN